MLKSTDMLKQFKLICSNSVQLSLLGFKCQQAHALHCNIEAEYFKIKITKAAA